MTTKFVMVIILVVSMAATGLSTTPVDPATSQDTDDLAAGVELAQVAAQHHADRLGVSLPSATAPTGDQPSEPILALYEHVGLEPDADALEELQRLDQLPADQTKALANTIWAFESLVTAALPLAEASPEADAAPETYAEVLAAQGTFLETLPALEVAMTATDADPIDQAPVIAVDLHCSDTTYTDDYLLIIDRCGNDEYENNAGGTIEFQTTPLPPTADPGCSGDPPPGESISLSAAVVDLSGDDDYGLPDRGCGVSGGGIQGAGTIVDRNGSDEYQGAHVAANGGAHFGVGHVLDLGLDEVDTYTADGQGANGGGFVAGVGTLIEVGGGATYTVDGTATQTEQATNGGGFLAGIGLLIDGPLGSATFVGDSAEWDDEVCINDSLQVTGGDCEAGVALDAPLPDDDGFGLRLDAPPPSDDDGSGLLID